MESKKNAQIAKETPTNHNLVLDNRKSLKIVGVTEVVSSTETQIMLKTECGPLLILGNNLHIKSLMIDQKSIEATGEINEIKYNKNKKPLLQRIFK